MNFKMENNSTQNESPAWLNSVVPGAYGLIGLVVVVALVFWAIRYVQPVLIVLVRHANEMYVQISGLRGQTQ
jgi:hypothetical protein